MILKFLYKAAHVFCSDFFSQTIPTVLSIKRLCTNITVVVSQSVVKLSGRRI